MRDPQRGEDGPIDTACCLPPDMRESTTPGNTFRYADGQLLVAAADDPLVNGYLTTTYPAALRAAIDEIATVRYSGIQDDVVALAELLRTPTRPVSTRTTTTAALRSGRAARAGRRSRTRRSRCRPPVPAPA